MRNYQECLHPVPNRGVPPTSFLDEMVDIFRTLPDSLFAPNANNDVYSLTVGVLGPWDGILHRKAAMAEIARVTAGFESSWKWNEGADKSAGPETTDQTETGAWQVSRNSILLDRDGNLHQFVLDTVGSNTAQDFITHMKIDHHFAVEYFVRLARISYSWDGPLKRKEVNACLWKPSVAEFQGFLS